jgi:hypothetical protein
MLQRFREETMEEKELEERRGEERERERKHTFYFILKKK